MSLGPSTIHDTNFTENINVFNTIFVKTLTDNVATLNSGRLNNLNEPINDNDACNKNYVDISSNIAGPLNSIQLNLLGNFASTEGLLYFQDTHTLYSKRTKINNVVVSNGSITSVNNPIVGTDGATKSYVDNFFTVGTIGSTSVSGTTYTAAQMYDNILHRSNLPDGITTDTTTSAGLLTSLANLNVGSTLTFTLLNKSNNDNAILRLQPGIGFEIIPSYVINIYNDQVMNAKINIEANSPSPAIWKDSVIVVSESDINLTTGGLLTIGSIALSTNDRVLVKDQNILTENGIYLANSSSWSRSSDATTLIQASYNILYANGIAWYCPSVALDNTTLKYGQAITFEQLTTQPSVKMYITSLSSTTSFTNLTNPETDLNFFIGARSINSTVKKTIVSEQFSFNTKSVNINTESGYVYEAKDVNYLIYRSGEIDRTDTFDSVLNFISETIYGKVDFLFSTGAVEFVIKNVSTIGNVKLANGNGWIMDPESDMTIKPGFTGYFYLYVNIDTKEGFVYTIGIFRHR